MAAGGTVSSADQTLRRVVEWGQAEAEVRRVVLVGSRVRVPAVDDLADIDVQIYCTALARYLDDMSWLSFIGEPVVCVRDRYVDGDVTVITRLVIFMSGVKVDFAFYPASAVSAGIGSGLPYATLIDKDAPGGASPGAVHASPDPQPPLAAEFARVIEEFWFEAYHIAKYLARGELLLAKSRHFATRQLLLTMIEWHEQFARGRRLAPDSREHRASMSDDTWHALERTFASADRTDTWNAARKTMELFRKIAEETAAALRFTYPRDVDCNLSRTIASIAGRAGLS